MAGFLSPLQHERQHSVEDAWIAQWNAMLSEEAKINFLMMLKERRDLQKDDVARRALLNLASRWISEKYIP